MNRDPKDYSGWVKNNLNEDGTFTRPPVVEFTPKDGDKVVMNPNAVGLEGTHSFGIGTCKSVGTDRYGDWWVDVFWNDGYSWTYYQYEGRIMPYTYVSKEKK